jgi:hypothetical protein
LVFSLQVSEYFLLFLLLLSASFIVLWSDSIQGVISIFLYLLITDLLCVIKYGLFLRKFHGLLRLMYIVLSQDGILYRCLLGRFNLWSHSILKFLCWYFCLFVWMTYLLVIEEYCSLSLPLFWDQFVFLSLLVHLRHEFFFFQCLKYLTPCPSYF